MSSIEDRLNELAKKIDTLTTRVDDLENTTLPLRVIGLEVSMEYLERDKCRWDEVYYSVFPERLRQDIKFEDELHHLKGFPPKPDDGKAKS